MFKIKHFFFAVGKSLFCHMDVKYFYSVSHLSFRIKAKQKNKWNPFLRKIVPISRLRKQD